METHSNQDNATDIPETKIVSAYGLRKCPKLVEQVCSDNVDVRVSALAVVCDEFSNPYSVQGCMKAGLATVLAKMISDPDFLTRERATRALAMAAEDANGVSAILEKHVVLVEVLNGIKDPSEAVRSNVYNCLYSISSSQAGREASVIAGIVFSFVDALMRDDNHLKVKILRTLNNIVTVPQGLDEALGADAVKICISLMKNDDLLLKEEAVRTLATLCFSETAKQEALDGGAIQSLCELLDKKYPTNLKVATTMAIMAITSTTAGRIQMHSETAVSRLSHILQEEDNRALRLNVLKVVTNVAVFPPIRQLLLEDAPLIKFMERLKESEHDKLLVKHSTVALEAVNWKP
jgi:hypothetical protein